MAEAQQNVNYIHSVRTNLTGIFKRRVIILELLELITSNIK